MSPRRHEEIFALPGGEDAKPMVCSKNNYFRPVPDAPIGQRAQTVAVIGPDNRRGFEEVAAEAVLPDGEVAGWLTRRGEVVPDDSILDGRMKR